VSSVTVTNAFSSTFDNYRIVWLVYVGSADADTKLTFDSTTTNYDYAFTAWRWNGAAFQPYNAASVFIYAGATSSTGGAGTIEVFSPNIARETFAIVSNIYPKSADGWGGHGAGKQDDNVSFTDFTLTAGSGTWTGGTIRVYGYNNG
jgi:hypothetical protein